MLYGKGVLLLVLFPMLGGLVVGVFSTYLMRSREGHGVVDVMETVMRSSGFIRPTAALEKILTSAVTIGSGGSAGAEGPIVQIGAGISSAFGQFFQVTRAHLPVLIGCGTAAGISAIFNAPIGGVLFTLEIILFDFSIRTFTPVVLASVVANVTTQAIFHNVLGEKQFSIFTVTARQHRRDPHAELARRARDDPARAGVRAGGRVDDPADVPLGRVVPPLPAPAPPAPRWAGRCSGSPAWSTSSSSAG